MGRPTHTAVREQQRHYILHCLEKGISRSQACRRARVARRTFYNWLEADPAFRERVEDAEAVAVGSMEHLAFVCAERALADPRYLRALFFFLKCKAGWRETTAPDDPGPRTRSTPPAVEAAPADLLVHSTGDGAAVPVAPPAQHTNSPAGVVPSVPFGPGLAATPAGRARASSHLPEAPFSRKVPAPEVRPSVVFRRSSEDAPRRWLRPEPVRLK